MALKKKPVTGMKDILPKEMEIRNYVMNMIRETYGKFGFSSIETPCVEHIENLSSKQGGQGVRYIKEKLKDVLDPKVAEDLETIIASVDAVKSADFKISFDPTLVRGMSYYTGPIFEIAMDEFGGSVGGGGRYDEMIGKFTGQNTSACGFSIGFERIVMLLLERGYEVPGTGEKKAYLIEKNMPADKLLTILKQAEEERRNGTQVTISIMKKNKKFQKEQMMTEGYTEFVEFFRDKL